MHDHELAAKLLQDHFTATAALIVLMLKNLPDDVRTHALDAVRNGTGKVELRTRVESKETGACACTDRWIGTVMACKSRRPMTLRAGVVATLWVVLFASSSVRAEFGTPYITPSHPLVGEKVSFNVYQGGCDGIVGADAPEVTRQGSYIYVLAQGVRYTNPELCTLTYGIATYPIGAYPIGDYAMQLDLRYPTIGGDFVVETLGIVNFSVREGAPTALEVPSLDRIGLIALAALIVASAAFAFAQRTRGESNETELALVPTEGSEPLWLARTPASVGDGVDGFEPTA